MKNFGRLGLILFFGAVVSSCQTTHETTSVLGDEASSKAGVTPEQLHDIGRDMSLSFLKKYPLVEDESVSLFMNHVGQYATMHLDSSQNIKCASGKPKLTPSNGFRFGVVKSTERVVMGLPGGFIYVSSAVIRDLKTEDQLAAILAHEATHVVCQDGVAELEKALGGADVENVKAMAGRAYETFFRLKFSRAQEKAADRGALMAAYRSGYYPGDGIELVTALKDHPVVGHAGTDERVNWMKKDFAKMQGKGITNTQKARKTRFAEFKTLAAL